MSGFDGNGNFFFTYSWVNDAANGIPITASRMDGQFQDAVGGFDLCLTRDNQGKPSATFLPDTNGAYDIGSTGTQWRTGYFNNVKASTGSSTFGTNGSSSTRNAIALFADSPRLLFGTAGTFPNWKIGAQDTVSNAITIASGSPNNDPSLSTYTDVISIFSSGFVGVGTVTDGGVTGVSKGEFNSGAGGSYALSAYQKASTIGALYVREDAGADLVDFYHTTTKVGSITNNGTNTAYNTSSDARLKDNIQDSGDAGSIIDALRVREWDWKSNGSHESFGFVAQEEFAAFPAAVVSGDDGEEIHKQWMRDDSKLVPLLVKEIQSLRARLAAAGIA